MGSAGSRDSVVASVEDLPGVISNDFELKTLILVGNQGHDLDDKKQSVLGVVEFHILHVVDPAMNRIYHVIPGRSDPGR